MEETKKRFLFGFTFKMITFGVNVIIISVLISSFMTFYNTKRLLTAAYGKEQEAEANKEVVNLFTQYGLGAVLSILITSMLAVLYARRISVPIHKLSVAAIEIGKGNLDQTVNIQSKDEIGFLAEQFNRMVTQLKKYTTDLEKMVEERTQELKVMKERAESASQTKSTFLANMSHELRTPLNAIIGLSEMLYEDAKEKSDAVNIDPLQRINNAGKHLLDLINSILDLSKIEAGKIELTIEEFDIKQLMNEIKFMSEPLAAKKSNKLEFVVDDALSKMTADSMKVKQIVINLISNACKFTEKGAVIINVKKAGDSLQIDVTDTGIGMTPEQLAMIFQAFTQADATTTRKYGGTGLGLAISKKLCELMGGTIKVVSEINKGTTFSVQIPLVVKKQNTESGTLLSGSEQKRIEPQIPQNKSKFNKILVIDNDTDSRKIISGFLKEQGYELIEASTGEEGVQMARTLSPGIVILEISLTGAITGWDVIALLKASPETKDLIIIVISILDEKNKGYSLGAVDYLVKPIDRKSLLDTVEKFRKAASGLSKVLVVDDDENTRIFFKSVLEKNNWVVTEAGNGQEAIEQLKNVVPDVILLDLMMPVMDGFDFLDYFRKTPQWLSIPVIVVTAKVLTPEERENLRGKVFEIIEKSGHTKEDICKSLSLLIKSKM